MKLSHLDRLSGISGIPGDESAVAEAIIRKIDGYAKWERDSVGTLFVYKEGKERRHEPMLVMTHMDEVGLLISHITDDGYLRFVTVGEIDSRVLPGRQVLVGENALPGVISCKAIHQTTREEREKPIPVDRLLIDIGAANREEAEKLVKIGDRYKSVKRAHLQSYFMVFKKNVINSDVFVDFINSVQEEHKKNDIIINYEIGLSEKLKDAGFSYSTYVKESGDNPTIYKWKELILKHHFPFIKCSLLRLVNNNTVTVNGWQDVIKSVCDYPIELIEQNLKRTYAHEPNDINAPGFSKQMYFGVLSSLPKNLVRIINTDKNVFYNVFKD